jgi:hypothetical protein
MFAYDQGSNPLEHGILVQGVTALETALFDGFPSSGARGMVRYLENSDGI